MKGREASRSELGTGMVFRGSQDRNRRQALASKLVVRETGDGGQSSQHLSKTLLVLVSTSNARRENLGRRGAVSSSCRKDPQTLLGFTQNLSRKGRKWKDNWGSHIVAFSPKESAKVGEQLQVLQLRGGASEAKDEKLKKDGKDFKRECYKALRNLLAGAIAGGSVEAALYPIDTIKTRLQATKGAVNLSGKFKALRGSSSLYSGLLGNLFGVIPASALFFSVYEPVKEKLQGMSAVGHDLSIF